MAEHLVPVLFTVFLWWFCTGVIFVLDGLPSGTPVTPVCFRMAPPSGHYYARWDDSDGVQVLWEGMDLMDLAIYLRPGDKDVNGQPLDPAVIPRPGHRPCRFNPRSSGERPPCCTFLDI